MDLKKMGRFIAELRNERGLTQKELADKLEIGDKSISKWERGINAPDISMLKKLSDELGISVADLLNGERESNSSTVQIDAIKFYNVRSKNKIISFFLIILLLIMLFFVSLFNWSNHNKYKVYMIKSFNENFKLGGYVILNDNKNIIFINDIEYIDRLSGTEDSIIIDNMNIYLVANNKIIYSYNYDFKDNNNDIFLEDFFENIFVYLDDNLKMNENIITHHLNDINLKFEYFSQDEKYNIEVPLNLIEVG